MQIRTRKIRCHLLGHSRWVTTHTQGKDLYSQQHAPTPEGNDALVHEQKYPTIHKSRAPTFWGYQCFTCLSNVVLNHWGMEIQSAFKDEHQHVSSNGSARTYIAAGGNRRAYSLTLHGASQSVGLQSTLIKMIINHLKQRSQA